MLHLPSFPMPPAAKVESRVALAELRDAASRPWISNAFSKTDAFERFFMRFQCFLYGVSECSMRFEGCFEAFNAF